MAARKKAISREEKAIIYCGPALPSGLLSRFVIYRNGLPMHLEEHFRKCPALEKMFVPVDALSATLSAIVNKGTAENALFQEVEAYVKGVSINGI